MAQRRFEDAVAAFSAARDAFSCAALSEGERRRRVEEIRFLRDGIRASERRSGDASLERGIGETASRAGRILSRHEAERRLHELEVSLRSTKPAPAGVALALGTALFQAGNLAEAELQFRSVVARDPGSGDAHHNLALICALTDRLDEAEREIDAARRAGVSTHPRLRAEVDRRRRLKSAAAGQETGGR
jgi:tetratricopeptide (TPR) repeat protein